MYSYKAKIISVYDGDTCTAVLDLGFKVKLEMKVRLYGVQAPELRTKDKLEKEAGYVVKKWVEERLLNKEVLVRSIKDKAGKFGRYLLLIFYEGINGETEINTELVDMGYALPYYGDRKTPFTKVQLNKIIRG